MRSSLVCSLSAQFHTKHVVVCFCTSVAVYFILTNGIMLCRLFFTYKINLDLIFIIFHQNFWKKHWFSCYFDRDYLAHLLQWLPPVEHCQPPWLLILVFCKCLMKCTSFGWSPASWPQIQCVSSFTECGDVAAIGRLCHSDSVQRLRWSSLFPFSHPWRATTSPEHHGENECWMKIDAAFEFQISGSCFIHLWAVDTIIPPVTLDRWGHCVMALVTLGQPEESWTSPFPYRHNVNRISCFLLGWGANARCWWGEKSCHCNFTTQP